MDPNTPQFPEIDDILGGILPPADSHSSQPTSTEPKEPGLSTEEEAAAGEPQAVESTQPADEEAGQEDEKSQLADVKALIGQLPGLGDETDTYMVRIYFDILSTLRACDFGTKSIPKIVNAILLDFINKNIDGLRAIARKTYL